MNNVVIAIAGLALTAACVLTARTESSQDSHKAGVAQQALVTDHEIEGYSDLVSVAPGETIKFFVHLRFPGTYTATFNRYGGVASPSGPPTAELPILTLSNMPGGPQVVPNNAYRDGAQWVKSFERTIPANWRSGYYAVRLHDNRFSLADQTNDFLVSFIVRDSPPNRKPITLVASTNTWQAYNIWPFEQSGSFYDTCPPYPVSFLRPNVAASPVPKDGSVTVKAPCNYSLSQFRRREHIVAGEIRIAQWLELNQWPYSVISDWDMDRTAGALNASVSPTVIISTHSEYWSDNMSSAIEAFLSQGGNVMSLSGNTIYRKVSTTDTLTAEDGSGHLVGNRTIERVVQGGQIVVFDDKVKNRLIGLGHGADGVTDYCKPYTPLNLGHWAFRTPLYVDTIFVPFGGGGVMTETSACRGTPGAAGAAAGWETDDRSPQPGFFRSYTSLARASSIHPTAGGTAEIVLAQRPSAGRMFAVGSIAFGQSLFRDSFDGSNISPFVENVLVRFQKRSFSDFNGDGFPDLLARDPSTGNVLLFPTDGAGNIVATGTTVLTGITTPVANAIIPIGDFDRDGHPDVLMRNASGQLRLYCGNGDGTFCSTTSCSANRCTTVVPAPIIDSGWSVVSQFVAPGDIFGDGVPSLLALIGSDLVRYRGDGTGLFVQGGTTLAPASPYPWSSFDTLIGIGDFNDDGIADLLARRSGQIWLFKGNGNGDFVQPSVALDSGWAAITALVPAGNFRTPAAGNPGMHPTLLARESTGFLRAFQGRPDGTFVQDGGLALSSPGGWNAFDQIIAIW
jgi:hypothetical protein